MAKVRDYAKLAKDIMTSVGEENIVSAAHCATRLRLVLKESPSAETTAEISAMPAVIQVVEKGGQYQIVIGTHAKDVYEELAQIMHLDEAGWRFRREGELHQPGYRYHVGGVCPICVHFGSSRPSAGLLDYH